MYVHQSRASRSRCSIPGTWYGTCKHPKDYKSEVRASVSRVKTPCEQGLPHYTCYKQSNAFLMRRRRRLSAVSPRKADPSRSTTLRGTRSARSGLGQRRCPKPKVMPRFTLGDVGEARWLLSHRWTDTSPVLPDAAHDSRNQGRVVSLSASSLLSACVKLRQLREVHHYLQQALNQILAHGRKAQQQTDHLPAAHLWCYACASCSGYRLNTPCVRCLCCCCTNSGACPVRPVLFGARSASDKCSVRCRLIKTDGQNLPQLLVKTYLR